MSDLYIYMDEAYARTIHLDEIAGQKVSIIKAEITQGQYHEIAVMRIMTKDGRRGTVATSARVILEAVKLALTNGAIPASATFIKVGQRWELAK